MKVKQLSKKEINVLGKTFDWSIQRDNAKTISTAKFRSSVKDNDKAFQEYESDIFDVYEKDTLTFFNKRFGIVNTKKIYKMLGFDISKVGKTKKYEVSCDFKKTRMSAPDVFEANSHAMAKKQYSQKYNVPTIYLRSTSKGD